MILLGGALIAIIRALVASTRSFGRDGRSFGSNGRIRSKFENAARASAGATITLGHSLI